jgi:hypothetical protein
MQIQPPLGQFAAQAHCKATIKVSDLRQHGSQPANRPTLALQLDQFASHPGGGLRIEAQAASSLPPAEAKPQRVIGLPAAATYRASEALASQGL